MTDITFFSQVYTVSRFSRVKTLRFPLSAEFTLLNISFPRVGIEIEMEWLLHNWTQFSLNFNYNINSVTLVILYNAI